MVWLGFVEVVTFFLRSLLFLVNQHLGEYVVFFVFFFAFSKHLFQANQSHVTNVDPQLPSATVRLSGG